MLKDTQLIAFLVLLLKNALFMPQNEQYSKIYLP
jgi:hypothetical protein